MSKKSRKTTVLAHQKPNRSFSKKFLYKWGAVSALVLVTAGALFYLANQAYDRVNEYLQDPGEAKTFRLTIKHLDGTINEEQDAKIASIVDDYILYGLEDELAETAEIIQRETQAEQVDIHRFHNNQLLVRVSLRQPILHVEMDQRRNVTRKGQVYGIASKKADLPLLTGIFNKRARPFELAPDQTFAIPGSEQELIDEATELYTLAVEDGYEIAQVSFVKYRGFLLRTKGDNIEIAIGRSPFKSRLRELKRILKDMKHKGRQVSRIELDYNGKAFIKEKRS